MEFFKNLGQKINKNKGKIATGVVLTAASMASSAQKAEKPKDVKLGQSVTANQTIKETPVNLEADMTPAFSTVPKAATAEPKLGVEIPPPQMPKDPTLVKLANEHYVDTKTGVHVAQVKIEPTTKVPSTEEANKTQGESMERKAAGGGGQ